MYRQRVEGGRVNALWTLYILADGRRVTTRLPHPLWQRSLARPLAPPCIYIYTYICMRARLTSPILPSTSIAFFTPLHIYVCMRARRVCRSVLEFYTERDVSRRQLLDCIMKKSFAKTLRSRRCYSRIILIFIQLIFFFLFVIAVNHNYHCQNLF